MRIAITGAGTLGASLAARLATTAFTTEVHWVNRDQRKVQTGVIDIQHGLAFALKCHRVQAYSLSHLDRALERVDVVVLTHGAGVPRNGTRAELYAENRDVFRRV